MLTDDHDRLSLGTMANLVEQIATLHAQGKDIVLVSSGAVAAGRHVLGVSREERDLPMRQVLAAAGQVRLMHAYEQLFSWHDIRVAQALLSRRDLVISDRIGDRLGYLNIRNAIQGILEHRMIPIINENDVVAVDEITGDEFGDNDTLSALVSNLLGADLLVMLGEVKGLYDEDPHVNPNANLVPHVERLDEYIKSMAGRIDDARGRGGMEAKLEAARLATASGVNVVIASGFEPNALVRVAQGESTGTFFQATSTRLESRKRWMLSGLSTKGNIRVDAGAVRAIHDQNRSLLPAGVTKVVGSFERGDIISIVAPDDNEIARGLANYSSEDVDTIKGYRSDRIADLLEHRFGEEVVHRNNMVIL